MPRTTAATGLAGREGGERGVRQSPASGWSRITGTTSSSSSTRCRSRSRPSAAIRPSSSAAARVGPLAGAHGREDAVGAGREIVDQRAERLVVALEQVEPPADPIVERLQHREILVVLDPVVAVQLVDQPRRHPVEPPGIDPRLLAPVEEAPGVVGEHRLHPAEAEVAVQPEAGQRGEVRMRLPSDPRVALGQQAKGIGQPAADRERLRVSRPSDRQAFAPLARASQAFSVRFFACARHVRSMVARAQPGSSRSGRASTSPCGRWWSVVKKVVGVGLDQEVALLDRHLEHRAVVGRVPVEDDLAVHLERARVPGGRLLGLGQRQHHRRAGRRS